MTTAKFGYRIAGWQFQRDGEMVRFQMELDPADFTQKLILDNYDARVFYEADVSGLMIKVLRKGDVVFDVGANCGYYACLASALVGAGGHVVAIEPAPDCVARLKANIALSGTRNVVVVEKVATNHAGQSTFHINRDNSGGHALWDPGEWPDNQKSRASPLTISTPATTLDAEWKNSGLPIPKLIKIDTEGAEQFVLEGARELLGECKVAFVVAELHEFGLQKLGCTQAGFRRLMEGFGYSTFGLFYSGAMPKFVPPGTQIQTPFVINILFATANTIAEYWPVVGLDPRSPQ